MGSLDQDVRPALAVRHPSLYYPGIAKLWFSRKVFSNFAIHGLVTSLIITSFALGKNFNTFSHNRSSMSVFLLEISLHASSPILYLVTSY